MKAVRQKIGQGGKNLSGSQRDTLPKRQPALSDAANGERCCKCHVSNLQAQ